MDELASADLSRAVAFHGHLCPGLAIGVRVARIALRELGGPAADEELVAIAECDNCSVDAVQALTGCTFGKGNLLFRDYGKTAYTFIRRADGRGLRIASVPRPRPEGDAEYAELRAKLEAGMATAEERAQLEELKRKRVLYILQLPEEQLFRVQEVQLPVPAPAAIRRSLVCSECGEPVMETRARLLGGQPYCIPCFEKCESRW